MLRDCVKDESIAMCENAKALAENVFYGFRLC